MIDPTAFCAELFKRGYRFFAGVPCSYLDGPISLLAKRGGSYVPAANEGAAMAMVAGARLAGTRGAVFMQNSGLGNTVNPITSLLRPYGIPVPAFVTLRGWPNPALDEPQHAVMGRATMGILNACGVTHWVLEPDHRALCDVLSHMVEMESRSQPCCVLVPKGTVGPVDSTDRPDPVPWSRTDALRAVLPHLSSTVVFSTTGYISRELCAMSDRAEHFYMQGSMGHVLSLALGAALQATDRQVVALDGDGAALMHLGSMSTVGAQRPPNLIHILIDNGGYDSTGGQPTTSSTVDWAALAIAVGYRHARTCTSPAEVDQALTDAAARPGPHLVTIRVSLAAGAVPPRVTGAISPFQLRARFESRLRASSAGVTDA